MSYDLSPYNQYIEDMIFMQWLRPESISWDTHAASLIWPHLRTNAKKIEIGTGNGFTSFSVLGGRFKKEFDWYYSVNMSGFWKNADVFDHDAGIEIEQFIDIPAAHQFELSVDHKDNLLQQAQRLGITKSIKVHDANEPLDLIDADIVFSNILYWLRDPIATFRWLSGNLKSGAKLVILIPTPQYNDFCRSSKHKNKLWTLLDRGRSDVMMWNMEPNDFDRMIRNETELTIEDHALYLSRQTLQIWDIGLRPFSPYLIKMANTLSPADRFEIKTEWCEGTLPMIHELCAEEFENGPKEGGFSFYILRKA